MLKNCFCIPFVFDAKIRALFELTKHQKHNVRMFVYHCISVL
nr:MAG TPA: hypothetical protein [Caudoviricetes sp.]